MRAHELPRISSSSELYLDMDGVLADFFAGYQKHNPSVKNPSDIMSAKDDPTIGKLVGSNFFSTLPKFKSADSLVDTVLQFVDHYNICSSPLRGDKENSELNKRKWIGMHLSPKPKDIIITSMKEKHARQSDGSPNILIDDKPSNINRWNAAGGIGILYNAYEDSPQLVHETLRNIFTHTLDEGWKDWTRAAGVAAALAGPTTDVSAEPQLSTPTTQSRDADEPVPAGYRLMTLPNGRDVAIPEKYSDEEALTLITKKYPDLVKPLVQAPKVPPKLARTKVTPEDLEKAKEVLSSDNAKILMKTAKKYGLRGTELAQFLAQCAHESLNFAVLHELGGKKYFEKYDPQHNPEKAKELGNTQVGDGIKYKGRGFLQITGRYNYAKAGEALGLPLEEHPELMEKPNVAAAASVWFWQDRVTPRVDNFNNTIEVTKPINKGLTGLQKRHDAFSVIKPVIKKG